MEALLETKDWMSTTMTDVFLRDVMKWFKDPAAARVACRLALAYLSLEQSKSVRANLSLRAGYGLTRVSRRERS